MDGTQTFRMNRFFTMNAKLTAIAVIASGIMRCFAPVDCPSVENPITHGDCDHKKPSASVESCQTPIQICAGAGAQTCSTTTQTYAHNFPKSEVENAHAMENDQDCWLEHTNCDSINAPCYYTATCFWKVDPSPARCAVLPNSESTWTWKLKRLKVECE